MGTTALIFYDNIVNTVTVLLTIFALVIEGIAFVHCVTQRSDAFPAIGTLPRAPGSPSSASASCSP